MGRLHELCAAGQSPWLDNLRRGYLRSGRLHEYLDQGVRGVTSNPAIFEKAIAGSDDYDDQFAALLAAGTSVEDAYWTMVVDDIVDALDILQPVHEASGGADGFVSVEVDPRLACDTAGTIEAARTLHERIDRANVMIKIPATAEGVPAIEEMIAEGRSINVTLIFSRGRYAEVMDAYLRGLERLVATGGDPADVHSVASFFISRVDTEIDRRLDALGTDRARSLQGRAAVAQGQLAYADFRSWFSGDRWARLVDAGANPQRPLWASTSTKNPSYPDTLYVDTLIGPDTVNTLPEATLEAFADHGTVARTVDADLAAAAATVDAVADVGVDLADVAATLEREGVDAFVSAFDGLLATLRTKAG